MKAIKQPLSSEHPFSLPNKKPTVYTYLKLMLQCIRPIYATYYQSNHAAENLSFRFHLVEVAGSEVWPMGLVGIVANDLLGKTWLVGNGEDKYY
jgi:hypothetical protein